MNYTELKKQTNVGWNTWNVSNVLSYSHLPEGFTINLCIKEYADNRVLRESMVGRQNMFPGVRSYDGSCTQMNLKYKGLELDVRTVVDDDEQIILLPPLKTGNYRKPTLIIEACLLWGKEGNVFKKNGRIGGECGGRTFTVHTTAPTVEAHHTYSLSPYIAVTLDAPVVVSTRPCSVAEAEALYAEAQAKLNRENAAFGVHAEAYSAMKTCLAWDTIYECEHDRICSPVCRYWCLTSGGYVLFDWDTYFAALMASLENRELALLNAIALTTLWDEDFGLFLNKDLRDGSLSRRISPTHFYALNADCVTETQKRRMMDEHFYNPEEFWGEFIMPTIARNDPAYPDQDYWRGRIWAPTNFLAYAAMKYAGLKQECGDLAKKSEELLLKEWRLHGHVHENYSGDDGMGCGVPNSDPFYHWGGLLAYIAIDNENSD